LLLSIYSVFSMDLRHGPPKRVWLEEMHKFLYLLNLCYVSAIVGELGKTVHKLYSPSLTEMDQAEKCRRWADDQNMTLVAEMTRAVQADGAGCPCFTSVAVEDNRFEQQGGNKGMHCFYTYEMGLYMYKYGTLVSN
jgi:hypothetical protein